MENLNTISRNAAVRVFPYTNEGNVEDDIDNTKRNIYQHGYIEGHNVAQQENRSYAARLLEWTAKEGFILINTTDRILWCRKAESISYNSSDLIKAFNEHEAEAKSK